MEKILITGGFGYIGGRIVTYLLSEGYHVIIATRMRPSQLPIGFESVECITINNFNCEKLKNAVSNVDYIIHLAAMNEIDSAKNPSDAVLVNIVGTMDILNICINSGCKRFIYLSTAHIYGAPLKGFLNEDSLPRPTHAYSITHRAAEDFVIEALDKKKILGIIVRLSNAFGYPVYSTVNRWTLLVNDLCKQAVTNRSLKLASSGIQIRDFIPLQDVCRGVGHLLRLDADQLKGGIFNLGSGKSVSVKYMAITVQRLCEMTLGFTPSIICPEPGPNENADQLFFSVDKLINTGFKLSECGDQEISRLLMLCNQWFGVCK